MKIINKIYKKISETSWKYYFSNSKIRVQEGGILKIGKNVMIKNSNIFIDASSKIEVEDNVQITDVSIFVTNNSFFKIGNHSILNKERNPYKSEFIINNGFFIIGNHCRLNPWRIWVRFKGKLIIGNYTNVNTGSEIRCDDNIEIGSFVRISYFVRIWDTNTHCMLSSKDRRKRTIDYFPAFSIEFDRPKTSPIKIKDDCWIGEQSAIMKGSNIGERSNIGFRTIILGKNIDAGSTVVMNNEIKTFHSMTCNNNSSSGVVEGN